MDRLSVSFVLQDFDTDPEAWDGYQRRQDRGEPVSETFSQSVAFFPDVEGSPRAFVGVHRIAAQSPHDPVYGKIEFNPSRVADPLGHSLADPGDVAGTLVEAVEAASRLVSPRDRDLLDSYRVKRIDVAKDFQGVTSASALIRGLAPIPRKWARKNLVHADPSRHGAQTLLVGSGAGAVRLYDKCAESKGAVPLGVLRWEAECRSGWASGYGGIRRVSDITDESVGVLARDRWEWSSMDCAVSSTSGVVESVARSGLTERERVMFVGWLVHQGTPWAWQPGSKSTRAKFAKLQRDLRVSIGPEAVSELGFASHLDWDLGAEVVTVTG